MNKTLFLTILISLLLLTACETTHLKPKNLIVASNDNVQLGLLYLQKNYLELAYQKLQLALSQNPDSVFANEALAYYFQQQNNMAMADKYYLIALKKEPNSASLLNNYGAFLCLKNEYTKGIHYLIQAQEATPENKKNIDQNIEICRALETQKAV